MGTTRINAFLLGLGTALVAGILAATALAAMRSERLGQGLCETTGGTGRYVAIPGFRGETIDRRLLSDIRVLERRFKIFITDGHSHDPAHAFNGEHPIGLALDIVPNVAAGGTWRDIDALARWAEPRQNHPIAPFRWVGYNGDSGHGRGHHLHLSWNHSETRPGVSPATVYTMRCPGSKVPARGGGGEGRPPGGGADAESGGKTGPGGIGPGPQDTTGGISVHRTVEADPVVETGGVGLP